MQNLTCSSPGQGCPLEEGVNPMTVHQGDCVNLDSDDDTYQVIGVDGDHDRCWVRRWPCRATRAHRCSKSRWKGFARSGKSLLNGPTRVD